MPKYIVSVNHIQEDNTAGIALNVTVEADTLLQSFDAAKVELAKKLKAGGLTS